jgi:hypothetical protein
MMTFDAWIGSQLARSLSMKSNPGADLYKMCSTKSVPRRCMANTGLADPGLPPPDPDPAYPPFEPEPDGPEPNIDILPDPTPPWQMSAGW